MAENGIQYSTGNTLNFTTNGTTWATLTSGGTLQVSSISATTYSNIPSSGGGTFTGGTVTGSTIFTSGLSANTFSATTATIRRITGGSGNTNSGTYSFIGGGTSNTSTGIRSLVGGGRLNTSSGNYSFVGGGLCNTVSSYDLCSSIVGGSKNFTSSGYYGLGHNFIGGGQCNNITADYTTVSGGYKNINQNAYHSFIGGGANNTISGVYGYNTGTIIVGGYNNTISTSPFGVIVGGELNKIEGGGSGYNFCSFIGGGSNNIVRGFSVTASVIAGGNTNLVDGSCHSNILGGRENTISGTVCTNQSTISGGYGNSVRCLNSFIGGGGKNTTTGSFSSILGGSGNTVSGAYSSAVGCGLTAVSARTFYTNNIIVSGTSTSQSTTTALDFYSSQSSGDEGGEIRLNKPATNSTISGVTTIDMFQNKLRIFESGGTNRGVFIDLTRAASTVGTNLIVPRISSGVDSPGNTTSGAFTIVSSVIISANTFTAGDVVSFKMRMRKSGTNGTVNYRISANSTLNLTGSQTVGVFNAGATIVYGELERTLVVKGATSEVFNTSITNVQSDVTTSTSAVSSLSIDWTINQYIMFNVNQSSNLDTTNISYYSILEI